ncbi:LuxR family two-component system response regulator [Streptomyces albidoflavus]|nr:MULTISPECIES: response regulator transcription factor [Streptomyces]AGI91272.1 LuxR family two-component system response regulator [Streptomyces albidoflavus]MBT2880682.1 response regulator transcription factor [Streptomyces sp. McG6]MBT2884654.1 response regulator transcription factor [Streptomyces sp. McG5]MBT2888979.1 response regulator transcription factor [Streptomyces sp. McG2]QLP95125.1 LuxR family two-component system response regulator [Streptomyces albidoflavus]
MTIRLVLADDERMVRTALRAILGAEPDLEVVGEAATGAEAVSVVRATAPDVVLMDVRMPEVDGIRATERVLAAGGERAPRVLVLTTFENDDHVLAALRAGAAGFLLKRAEAETLLHAVRVVARSDTLLFPSSVRALALAHDPRRAAEPPWAARLTDREREVLHLMATGLTNAEIAARLTVGPATVKSHVAAVLAKTGTRDRTQAVIAAYEAGLTGP